MGSIMPSPPLMIRRASTPLHRAEFNYNLPPTDGREPQMVAWRDGKRPDESLSNTPQVTKTLPVHDMRSREPENKADLDRSGFTYAVRPEIDLPYDAWGEEKRVKGELYPKLAELVQDLTDAPLVVPTHYILRGHEQATMPAAFSVHVDVDKSTAYGFAKPFLAKAGKSEREIEELLKGRIRVMQVWKPIRHKVYDSPFAVVDSQTIDKGRDLVRTKLLYDKSCKPDHMYVNSVRPGDREEHKWYSLPEQAPEEVVVFKGYDSEPGKACGGVHSSYKHPELYGRLEEASAEAGVEMKERQSIDVRFWAFG